MTPILVGLLGLGVLRAANGQVHRFERLAALEISSLLEGDEKQVEIRSKVGPEAIFGDVHQVTIAASRFRSEGLPLYTEPQRSRRGILRNLRIVLSDFDLKGLRIERMESDIPDCRFDLALALNHHRFRLSRSGVGVGRVAVRAEALAAFILKKYREIKKVEVRIEDDKIFVDGIAQLLVATIPFSVVARLEPTRGSQLSLAFARVLIDGKPTSDEMQKTMLSKLNPVVDLNRDLGLMDAMKVERLILRNGVMTAEGAATVPASPAGTNRSEMAL